MKTPTNTARDLLLLAMIAHSNKKYDTAGSLFSASLASSDIEDLVNTLHTMTDEPGVSQSSALTFDPCRDDSMSISAIASVLAAAMEEEDESQAEDGDGDLAGDEAGDEEDGEEDDGEDDGEEDDGEDGGEDLDSGADEEEPVVDSTALDDDGDDSTDDMDPDSPGDTLLPSSISSVYEEEQAPQVSTSSGIKRVLARRIRPDLGGPDDAEEANASDNIEPTAKSPAAAATAAPATPIQEFASVLPAGRSPVTLRR